VVDDNIMDVDLFANYNTYNKPAIGLIWAGSGAALSPAASTFSHSSAYYVPSVVANTYRSVTIPAGQSLALISFVVQQTTTSAAKASAERLVQLPPEALNGLSSQEQALVVNFAMPANGVSAMAPLPPLTGTITGVFKGFDGQTSTLYATRRVTLRSDSPYFARTYNSSADSTTGAFTFSYNQSNGYYLVPQTGFTLQGSVQMNIYTTDSTSPPISGSFAVGAVSAVQDIAFSNNGRITASVVRSDGTPVVNAAVVSTFGTPCPAGGYCTTTPDFYNAGSGSYILDFVQAGQHNLTATIPAPGGYGNTSLTVTGAVTAAVGVNNTVELRLPPLGSISGFVKNVAGAPVAGNSLSLSSTTNTSFRRSVSSTATGSYSFDDLPADTYLLQVSDISNYMIVYRYTVTVASGEAVVRDLPYTLSGTITGTVRFRTPSADTTYYPEYVPVEVRDPATGRVITSTNTAPGSYTTSPFASNSAPVEVRATLTVSGHTYTATATVNDFSSNGQQLNANLTLPVDRSTVLVQVVDPGGAPLLKPLSIELRTSAGQVAYSAPTSTGQYTFSGIITDQTSLTARVVFAGRSFDQVITLVPNGTATATFTMPLASLGGNVFIGDGITPLDSFSYSLKSADGTVTFPCGSYRNYWGDLLTNTTCTGTAGSWSLTDLSPQNAVIPRMIPIQSGDNLVLQVSYSGGTISYPFTYSGSPIMDATLPIFLVKGSVKLSDATVVPYNSVTMVLTDAVDPTVTTTYSGYSDANGNYTIMGAGVGSFTLMTQTGYGAQAVYPGGGTLTSNSMIQSGLDLIIEPTGSISGSVTRGAQIMSYTLVKVVLPDRGVSFGVNTDGNGRFTFIGIPFTSYTVTARGYDNSDNYVYSHTVSGALTAAAPTADVQVLFDLLPGTIFGTVRDSIGNAAFLYSPLTLTHVSDGVIYAYTSPDSLGRYQTGGLPADGYLIEFTGKEYSSGSGVQVAGSAYGVLSSNGVLQLDLTLQPELSVTTAVLTSAADSFTYGLNNGGVLAVGGNSTGTYHNPFASAHALRTSSAATDIATANGWNDVNGQLVIKPSAAAGLRVGRKIYHPVGGGYLRYLETFDNPGATPISMRPELHGSLAVPVNGTWSYVTDSSASGGRYVVEEVTADAAMPKLGMVMQGTGAVAAAVQTAASTAAIPDWAWNLEVPAGGKSCLLNFVFLGTPQDTTMAARAQALSALDSAGLTALGVDGDPLFGLIAEERACIKNFIVPPAP
jgi:hypothetical protein